MNNIIIRKAISDNDCKNLKSLLNTVFEPEKVGDLAEIFFHQLPGMKKEYWFIAEDTNAKKFVSAFTLIPWVWEFEGIHLKIAEMGLVGTLENYRGLGLMKLLNKEFDNTIIEESFDFAAIQGIPGFYYKFSYFYSIPLENHINMPLHFIKSEDSETNYNFRIANLNDIPFLLKEDESYRKHYSISVKRNEDNWKYLLNEGKSTDYGSEFWILENVANKKKFYFRILLHGFGTGLIINEISVNADIEALKSIFCFCKELAATRQKPYIRLSLPNSSEAGKYAFSLGSEEGRPYAWQIKIHNKTDFLKKIKPVLEKRITNSSMNSFSGKLRLDLYQESIDLDWKNGKLISIGKSSNEECTNTFCLCSDLFPALFLGYRSWQEIQFVRPDIFPSPQYVNPYAKKDEDKSGALVNILFPKTDSWINLQY